MKGIKEIYKLRDSKLKELGYSSYAEYLNSEEWWTIKQNIRKRKSPKWSYCNICGSQDSLDIHHSSYKVLGLRHPGNTVKLLCRDCHNELHRLSKLSPTFSFYRIAGRMRRKRMKLGQPYFNLIDCT